MKFFQEASTAWWDRQLRRGRITAAWNVMGGIMSKGRFSAFFVAAVVGISVYVDTPALAVTIDATRFGIYENFGVGVNDFSHSPNTGQLARYDVGSSFSDPQTGTTVLQRDYFVFNLAGVTGTVTGATLSIFSPSAPTQTNASDTLAIFDVTTPVNTLIGNAEGAGAYGSEFADLATGTQYGSVLLNPTTIQAGTQIDISLANALSDINAHQGGLFAVGGTINPLNLISGGGPYYLNGGTFAPNAQLTLQTSGTSVPEPTTGMLMLIEVSGLIMWRHFASGRTGDPSREKKKGTS
jgi:hypothetical protein